jgi:hypothetical protein
VCPVIGPFQTWGFALEGIDPDVIEAPKLEPQITHYELRDHVWAAIKPMLPHKPRSPPSAYCPTCLLTPLSMPLSLLYSPALANCRQMRLSFK